MPLVCSQLSLLAALPTSAAEVCSRRAPPHPAFPQPGEGVAPGSFPAPLALAGGGWEGSYFPTVRQGFSLFV